MTTTTCSHSYMLITIYLIFLPRNHYVSFHHFLKIMLRPGIHIIHKLYKVRKYLPTNFYRQYLQNINNQNLKCAFSSYGFIIGSQLLVYIQICTKLCILKLEKKIYTNRSLNIWKRLRTNILSIGKDNIFRVGSQRFKIWIGSFMNI
jgi:hypothetical protein